MTDPVRLPLATQFCAAEIPLDLFYEDGPEITLFVDGNSKITASAGTYAEPRPNAFSLPAASVDGGSACPGSTEICRASCYVKGLAKHAPDLYEKYRQNDLALEAVLDMGEAFADHAAEQLAAWIRAQDLKEFRWHVSGDVKSIDHAMWIVGVCNRAPETRFWIYTRTLPAVGYLTGTENLAVNISADRENLEQARVYADLYPGTRLCYLSDDGTVPALPDGSVIFPDYPLRGRDLPNPTDHAWWWGLTQEQRAMVCPTDFFGQSEAHRCGPCRKCL